MSADTKTSLVRDVRIPDLVGLNGSVYDFVCGAALILPCAVMIGKVVK